MGGRRWASTSSVAGRWGPDDRLRAAEGNGTGTAEATPVAAHLTLSRRPPRPRRGTRRSGRAPRRAPGAARARASATAPAGRRTSVGIARLEEVDPRERVGRAGQQQRRDRDPRPVGDPGRRVLGPAGRMERVGQAHQRRVRATRLALLAARRRPRRATRPGPPNECPPTTTPGSSGTCASNAAIASSALRFGRSRAMRLVAALAQAVDPGLHRRGRARRAVPEIDPHHARPRYRVWRGMLVPPVRAPGWSHRPMARAGTATSRLGSMAIAAEPDAPAPTAARPPHPLADRRRARAVDRRRRGRAGDGRRPVPCRVRAVVGRRRGSTLAADRTPTPARAASADRAARRPARLAGAPTGRGVRTPTPSPTPTPTAVARRPPPRPRRHRRHAHADPDAPTPWPTPAWPTTVTTLGTTVRFYGQGWGHGVGMNQYGARAARRPARTRSRSSRPTTRARRWARSARRDPSGSSSSTGSRPPPAAPLRHLGPRWRRGASTAPDGCSRPARRSRPGADAPGGTLADPQVRDATATSSTRIVRDGAPEVRIGAGRRSSYLQLDSKPSSYDTYRGSLHARAWPRARLRSSTTSVWTVPARRRAGRDAGDWPEEALRAQAIAARSYARGSTRPTAASTSTTTRGRRSTAGVEARAEPRRTRSSPLTRARSCGNGTSRQRVLPLDRRRLDREQRVRVRVVERRPRARKVAYLRGIARPVAADGTALRRRLAVLRVVDDAA